MFRTVFPSIIRRSKLLIQKGYFKQLLPPAAIGDEAEEVDEIHLSITLYVHRLSCGISTGG
jgi:hypothetical protein